ncbi:magnesium chelatase subunit D family protein [Glaciimonas sp. PAMC28666]|uniref:magnesium chelatase subunit D family protein n=1 Tax=Glaciimonas sp. PAMC28666 TaxID=2807626 RepID=UPI0019641083|nr:magnesium chelatase subunit D family protein [Glaciimonas sp. PAMC28666]QRX84151.1 magnesium chelatase subunit D family protein [Glaciimonas sp. PAMC28666]
MKLTHFPFSAIVEQPQLKTALLLCAIDPTLGGVLIRGDKGTAKSTAARALPAILPTIERSVGCAFNCRPDEPCELCDACLDAARTVIAASVPFVTLPLGATEDRVLGTLDLQRALKGEARPFQPGLLASAHRGILYIDEVNLLADHLVDVLLDVAAMGVNSVQREGLSVTHPARLTLIGTMNLEEGDLRPQLLDRFGLMVEVVAPRDKTIRAEVVRRRIRYEADPVTYVALWSEQQAALLAQLSAAQKLLPTILLSDALLDLISHLCCEFEVASLRADIVMHKAARALAALEGRASVTPDDIRQAAQLVLPHRRRRKPFEQPGLDQDKLDELMQQGPLPPALESPPTDGPADGASKSQDGAADDPSNDNANDHANDKAAGETEQQPQIFSIAAAANARQLAVAEIEPHGVAIMAGRRSDAQDAAHGRIVRTVPDAQPRSLAIGATLRTAAMRNPTDFQVTSEDVQGQVRVGKTANLILFVVDASGSMAAQRRMEAVKGAVLSLLTDAYQRRDEVAVIAFGGQVAQVVLAPTRGVDLAEKSLRELATGGRTPLPHALQLTCELLQRRAQQSTSATPLLVILSDGKANVALTPAGDAWRETLDLAAQLAASGTAALVLDTEDGYLRLGRAAQLAQALGAECLTLEQLSADNLALTIRARMQ